MEVEAANSTRTCYKFGVAELEKEENNKINKLLEKIFHKIRDQYEDDIMESLIRKS